MKRTLLITFMFVLAAIVLLAGLLPGDISPAGAFKSIADLSVADGDFEVITVDFYNGIRPAFTGAGLLVLAIASLLLYANRTGRQALWRWMVGGMIAAGIAATAVLVSLAAGGLNSPVYRLAAGTPVSYIPPTVTPIPTFVYTPTPVPAAPAKIKPILNNLPQPVVLTHANDGSGRVFIGLRTGLVYIYENDALRETPFLDLTASSIQAFQSIEQGLLGVAFHPNYVENGYFYIYYIDYAGNSVLARFNVSPDDPNRADPESELRMLGVVQPNGDHNGGNLVFGPDGFLYIGIGDGGVQRDPNNFSQSPDILLGKILRIDVDSAVPYGIPPDNPYVGKAGIDEIFAIGMRNPWRFTFDTLTDDLYIADVGHRLIEEINFIPAGTPGGYNLGWNHYEGMNAYTLYPEGLDPYLPDHTPPVWEYTHGDGGRCAVVGGFVYRGEAIPALQGRYIYGDHCTGEIWGLYRDENGDWVNEYLFDNAFLITSFGMDEDGEIFVMSLQNQVFKFVP